MDLDEFLQGAKDRLDAREGKCPEARTCKSLAELAGWFRSVGVAAGVNARTHL